MKPVKEVNLEKPVVCKMSDKAIEVAKLIKNEKARHVLVVDEKGFPKGIISTVDINNRIVAEGKDPSEATAEQIMTSPIMVKNAEDDLGEVYRTMMKQNIYSMPIVEAGKLKGLLTFNKALEELTGGRE